MGRMPRQRQIFGFVGFREIGMWTEKHETDCIERCTGW